MAVKVQHHFIKESIQIDVKFISNTISLLELLFKDFEYSWLSNHIKMNLWKEIDFRNEYKNSQKIREHFKGTNIYFPKYYEQLVTPKLIVMEFIDGYSITNKEQLIKDGINIKKVLNCLSDAFCRMIFEIGFLHSDPHPGNIFV